MLICDGTLAWWKNITFAGVSDLSKASVSNLYDQRALSQNISATIYGGRLKRAKPFCDCEPPFIAAVSEPCYAPPTTLPSTMNANLLSAKVLVLCHENGLI